MLSVVGAFHVHKPYFGAPGTDERLCSCSKLSLGILGDLNLFIPNKPDMPNIFRHDAIGYI